MRRILETQRPGRSSCRSRRSLPDGAEDGAFEEAAAQETAADLRLVYEMI